ncbi:hypothetical protein BP5796_11718 [Coleophoma crateriformis]|uniref:Uncharacterized protein n=1 Tax=Coleophoma crateriformis TaxID=565419 RepID=A0A3D8QE36_9HELO|nr:hypothetical protein BP5796_11718 [Coleophoma crateriformis]
MSSNPDSVSNQGEFHSRIAPSEPLTTSGHKPGLKVGSDAAPEFHAQTLPTGTAPADRTFKPDTTSEVPGQAMNPNISKETWTSASDTIGGATSADVHTGYGLPEGQASTELHGSGATKGKKEELGLAGRPGGPDKFEGTLDGGRP